MTFFFQNDESDPYYPSCHVVEAKLRDKYSSYKREKSGKKIGTFHDGLQIDISVYDRAYLPVNLFIYTLNRTLIFFFKHKSNKKRADVLKWISKHSLVPLVYGSSFICNLKRMKLRSNYIKEEEIKSFITRKFEDVKVFIPAGWESYLKRQYGNYLQLPASEKQKGNHGADIPDPFTPCNHSEILHWNSEHIEVNKNY